MTFYIVWERNPTTFPSPQKPSPLPKLRNHHQWIQLPPLPPIVVRPDLPVGRPAIASSPPSDPKEDIATSSGPVMMESESLADSILNERGSSLGFPLALMMQEFQSNAKWVILQGRDGTLAMIVGAGTAATATRVMIQGFDWTIVVVAVGKTAKTIARMTKATWGCVAATAAMMVGAGKAAKVHLAQAATAAMALTVAVWKGVKLVAKAAAMVAGYIYVAAMALASACRFVLGKTADFGGPWAKAVMAWCGAAAKAVLSYVEEVLAEQNSQRQEEEQQQKKKVFGKTKDGKDCKNCIKQGGYCHQHKDQNPKYNNSAAGKASISKSSSVPLKPSPPLVQQATFGRTRKGEACKSCIKQGGYCHRHKDQDPSLNDDGSNSFCQVTTTTKAAPPPRVPFGWCKDGRSCKRCEKLAGFCYDHVHQQQEQRVL